MSKKEDLQKLFNHHFSQEVSSLKRKDLSAGQAPKKKNRVNVVGATVLDKYEVNPTDGGVLVNYNYPLFSNISIDDINQGYFADCYFLSFLGSLARVKSGQDYLRSIMYLDPANPQMAIVQYQRNGLVTRLHCDLLVSTQGNDFDPNDQDLWVELMEKTYADFRTVNDAYHSLDYGFSSAVASDLGCTPSATSYVNTTPGQTIVNQCMGYLNQGKGVTMLTPPGAGFGLIPSHSYTVIGVDLNGNLLIRNPWGKYVGNPVVPVPVSSIVSSNLSAVEYGLIPGVISAPLLYTQIDLDAAKALAVKTEKAKVYQLLQAAKSLF